MLGCLSTFRSAPLLEPSAQSPAPFPRDGTGPGLRGKGKYQREARGGKHYSLAVAVDLRDSEMKVLRLAGMASLPSVLASI